ncbi:MAG TPA: hypothetical protein VFR33_13640 [Candidatus Dormibacteraeota bacterium]|nr:hypothetical protein [Candidatus Dormibacteraeota bacterium]
MPSAAVAAPVVLPLAAAAVIATLGLAGINAGRPAAAVGAWATVAALLAIWLPIRASVELVLGQLGYGSALDLRLDAVSFAFALMIVVPAAILLTLQPRPWPDTTIALLGVGSAVAAVEAGGVVLTAIAGGTAATVAIVLLDTEDPDAERPSWGFVLAGWLGLALAGVILQVGGGTAVYSAVPVSQLTPPLFSLLLASGLLVSSLVPWRSWPAALWSRPSLRAAGITLATLFPLGFYLLVRVYEMGDGRYPATVFNVLLSILGLAIALAAAARAQAAPTRREFLAEVVPGFGGFALTSIALGSPLGLATGIVLLAAGVALIACLALLPDRAGIESVVTIAAAVGLPPSLTFAARVLGIEAAFEAGDFLGLIGLAGAATWAVWVVAGARAIGLPGGRGHPAAETFPFVAMAIALLVLVAGPALALLQSGYANPVAAQVMRSQSAALGGGLTSVVTTSSLLPVATLFTPLLVIAVAVYFATNTRAIRTQARPALFAVPSLQLAERVRAAFRNATVPEEYRSIFNLRELESAAARGNPIVWLVALVALGFAVTRF